MIRISLISRCAVIGAFSILPALISQAQDDPFGLLGEGQTGGQGVVAPAQAADDPLAAEKSLLAVERPNDVEAEPKDFCRCVGETDSPAVVRIEAALRGPLNSRGLDFTDTPLEEIVNVLQEDYDIPVQIDTPALEETGLDPAEPVTTSLHNISLRSGLRLMLKPLDLTYIIRDEVLLITTPDEAGSHLLTCVYDVRDLIDQRSSKSVDDLIDTIVSCVSTKTWSENGGGEAEIRPLSSGLFVVSQTQAVHEEIGGLLAAIRKARDEQPAAADIGSAPAPDNDEVVTRSYVFKINQAGDQEKLRDQMRELIVQSMPDERWEGRLDDGQAVVLAVLPDRVVLRHRPSVHESVQALLVESGIAAASSRTATHENDEGGGGGGFFQVDSIR